MLKPKDKTKTLVSRHILNTQRKHQEEIKLLLEKINGLVQEAEQMETSGRVKETRGLVKLCNQ